ncbi:T9SS type A sorting domain-containing protein [Vicingus serpentipes]|uniref:T9SS type A sorting domain-containing protein n=1 Tax=Vicingus serpentipes TaxID=1926625 RepID=A0A5C6RS36_9FLAO|nr:InlB B-repeat-containing protein [Vicingus serpentipes]TXB65246.1 T9SS type A sorting domain-containing protein [Vicingus serpentipes]
MLFRVILLSIVLLICRNLHSQATIPVSRDTWSGAEPTGWSKSGTSTYGTDVCGASNSSSAQFNTSGDYIIVNYNGPASDLTFCIKGNPSSGSNITGTFTVQESIDGITYSDVNNYINISNTSNSETETLSCNSRYLKFIYTNKTSGNIALDDVSISTGVCSGSSNYTVNFNGNGSDGGSMSDQTASSSTALTTNSFTQTGCTFIEWNTVSNGSGTSYSDGATYDFSADITLYAQWNCPVSCTPIFSDDFSATLSQWSNTTDWAISSGELNHNLSGVSGTSYIFHDLGVQDLTTSDFEWSFCMRNGNWDPSGSNYFGYYLISDGSDFFGTPNGYTVGVNLTGTSDLITLYRVDAGVYTAIITSAYDWNSTDDVCIRITRTSAGIWQLYYDSGSGETSAGTQTDIDYTSGQYTGGLFEFSTTRAGELWIDDVSICGSTPPTNTITTGSVSGSPFSVQCAVSDNGTVAFTSTDTFGAGNVYTAQLSDGSGNFGSPINIGTLVSTANSGTINFTIPGGTPNGANYKIRVISSNPYVIGSESSTFTINLTDGHCAPPHITSVLFNGCDPVGCGGEGRSEIVFANTGANSVLVNSANFDLIYPAFPAYDLLGTVVSNNSTITTMNDSAACGTVFYDANGQTLPPNSTMLLVSSSICAEVNFDWSGLCGQGPIYVVFGQSAASTGDTWHDSGNFGNSSGTKDFDLDITATDGNTYSYTYSYTSSNQGDGEFATFSSTSPGGNAVSVGVLADCNVTTEVLPIKLLFFKGKKTVYGNLLEWTTTTEINNDYFTLERAEDGFNFNEIGIINGAGNSSTNQYYQFTDDRITNPINYYRLKQTDFNGEYSYSNTIALSTDLSNMIYYNNTSKKIEIGDIENGTVSIYNIQGQLIKTILANNENIPLDIANGMYIVTIQTANQIYSKKIVVR